MTAPTKTQPSTRIQTPASASAIVHLHMGKPVTDSLAMSREFLRRHDNVLQSLDGLIADKTIGLLDFKESYYLNEQGKKQRMIELTEAGALIAMPFIGGRNSRAGQVRLVKAFMSLRAELAAQLSGGWVASRKDAVTGYQLMCDAIQAAYAKKDEAAKPRHYMTEAKLINWILFGDFKSVIRNDCTQGDLTAMDKLERCNAMLIDLGRTYEERKAALPGYLVTLRVKQPRIAS